VLTEYLKGIDRSLRRGIYVAADGTRKSTTGYKAPPRSKNADCPLWADGYSQLRP